MMKLPI